MLVRMCQNKDPYTLLVGMQITITTMESSMEIPKKAKDRTAVILLLGTYPKECKMGYNRDTYIQTFITALFTTAKFWKQPRCPTTDEWVKRMRYIYTKKYYSPIRNNGMWFGGKWM
jgi:hypothetical protein